MKNTTQKPHFWKLLGIIIGLDLIITLLYAIIIPGFSGRAWSDSLCTSALFLGLSCAIPVLFDVGRGMGVATKMGEPLEERQKVMDKEHQRREQGMTISFALIAATLFIAFLSLVLGLL